MGKNGDEPGFEPLARGAGIGRYVVLNLLGRGGMGEVYAAFDPELDRKVAVKLLRARIENGVSMSEGRQRTLREAQAIARLAHPNVVVVYDVGTFREQVFIAMEFVDGHTASYWVQAQTRTWQEILKVYLAAGRGLQAAHEKGLVHRDFKPENVMVARNGEVRVMDFGLAREIEARPTVNGPGHRAPPRSSRACAPTAGRSSFTSSSPPRQAAPTGPARPSAPSPSGWPTKTASCARCATPIRRSAADLFSARLTRTGAIMGTPAYMAPEQFFKAGTDARSDQFSFCVTLYEALYGERPFPGNNIQTLVGNIVQGNIRDAPASTKVPSWVRKVLLRGLRPTAAERYPSMAEILDALKTDPRAKYRRIAIGVALAHGAAGGRLRLPASDGRARDGVHKRRGSARRDLGAHARERARSAAPAPHPRRVLEHGQELRRRRLRDGSPDVERLRPALVQHVQGDLRSDPRPPRTVPGRSGLADGVPQ